MTPADPIPPPVTPEPLSAEELAACDAIAEGRKQFLYDPPPEGARLLKRLIAQARAALAFSAEIKSGNWAFCKRRGTA